MKRSILKTMILPVMHLYSGAVFHEHQNTHDRIQKMEFYPLKG